jgi:dipeptidase D
MSFVAELEPTALWAHFDKILTIPRGSKNEAAMRDYVIEVAKRNGLSYKVDGVGNLVVRKAGSKGFEGAATTILQGHLDMVNENNSDVKFDWEKDPIQPQKEGEYLKATGTTLGSDNGIGLAAMLAVMEAKDLDHGPMEFLFTIDEETGLTGAAELGNDMLEGRQLLNLDSEEEGVLTIGCAGGADTDVILDLNRKATPDGAAALEIHIAGLKGGHSGIDIHLQRGNAIKILARALHRAAVDHPLLLAAFAGGSAHNAIPREAKAQVVIPGGESDAQAVKAALSTELEAIRAEIRTPDPGLEFKIESSEAPGEVWDEATGAKVLNLITGLPHGVEAMSNEIAGLVETSTNLAVVTEADGKLTILMSTRSSVASALEALRRRIRATATLAAAQVVEKAGYPGWQPDTGSRLLEVLKKLHVEVMGSEPEVGAVHAGLECGIIGEKFPGMDMISFGPQIEFPHSPDERVKIDTVERFYNLLAATLKNLAQG